MPPEEDADDDVGGFDPPLPPEDRLWRHPSEMGSLGRPHGPPAQATPAPRRRAPVWPIALIAGLVGAVLSTAVMAATGSLSTEVVERAVVEKVAVTPFVSPAIEQGAPGVAAIAERLAPAIARLVLTLPDGTITGSAVIFRDDGLLLTSARLVATATAIEVALADGRRFDGHILGSDRLTDVAVLEIDANQLPVAVLGASDDLDVGSPTLLLGSAAADGQAPSVSTGVISALERRVDDPDEILHGMIQTDAPTDVGGVGGPLVDATGSVIGILTPAGTSAGDAFGFATPIDLARRVARQLIAAGRATHGWLGIEGVDLSSESAEAFSVKAGVRISRVLDDSPASAAGFSADDVITEVDDEPVDTASGLVVVMRDRRPGDTVIVGYWRDGAHQETAVTVGRHP